MVGIKLANGEFYPILEESERVSKKVVLTTVRDDQTNVQIDLYRGAPEEPLSGAEYIASLVLENITPNPKGQSDIELSLSMDEKFNLSALARETLSGEYQSLRINIECLECGDFDMPDFELDGEAAPQAEETESLEGFPEDADIPAGEEDSAPQADSPAFPSEEPAPVGEQSRSSLSPNPVALSAFLVFGFLILAVLLYLFFHLFKGTAAPPLKAGFFPLLLALSRRKEAEKEPQD